MGKIRFLGILAALAVCWLAYKVVAATVWLAVLCIVLACAAAMASRLLGRSGGGIPRDR